MINEDGRELRELFATVCDLTRDVRRVYLDRVCKGNAALRDEVDALVSAYGQSESPIDTWAHLPRFDQLLTHEEASGESDSHPLVGTAIGRYRILQLLGTGGMGSVFKAEQESPRRVVALKLVSVFASAQALKRFEAEAQALGMFKHPGIAQIYDSGTEVTPYGPQPFFAMELIDGPTIIEYADQHELNMPDRLRLFARVCDAVQHAHLKGVVHRDIKPGNILVCDGDNTEDGTPQPKILDFGVAGVTDTGGGAGTRHTQVGQLIGTLAYMSPEQATDQASSIDLRSDVYALGVLLYELLSGKVPFDLNDSPLLESIRRIREEEPDRLGLSNRACRGDVETIVSKALSKDQDRRYQSALELANDVRRFLHREPVEAKPKSLGYVVHRFVVRRKALVAAVTAIVAMAGFGVSAMAYGLVHANEERRLAEIDARKIPVLRDIAHVLVGAMDAATRPANHASIDKEGMSVIRAEIIREFNKLPIRIDALSRGDDAVRADGHLVVAGCYRMFGETATAKEEILLALTHFCIAYGPDHTRVNEFLSELAYIMNALGANKDDLGVDGELRGVQALGVDISSHRELQEIRLRSLCKAGRDDEALAVLAEFTGTNMERVKLMEVYADCCRLKGQHQKADQAMRDAIEYAEYVDIGGTVSSGLKRRLQRSKTPVLALYEVISNEGLESAGAFVLAMPTGVDRLNVLGHLCRVHASNANYAEALEWFEILMADVDSSDVASVVCAVGGVRPVLNGLKFVPSEEVDRSLWPARTALIGVLEDNIDQLHQMLVDLRDRTAE